MKTYRAIVYLDATFRGIEELDLQTWGHAEVSVHAEDEAEARTKLEKCFQNIGATVAKPGGVGLRSFIGEIEELESVSPQQCDQPRVRVVRG